MSKFAAEGKEKPPRGNERSVFDGRTRGPLTPKTLWLLQQEDQGDLCRTSDLLTETTLTEQCGFYQMDLMQIKMV